MNSLVVAILIISLIFMVVSLVFALFMVHVNRQLVAVIEKKDKDMTEVFGAVASNFEIMEGALRAAIKQNNKIAESLFAPFIVVPPDDEQEKPPCSVVDISEHKKKKESKEEESPETDK